jgi:hypothetical protein
MWSRFTDEGIQKPVPSTSANLIRVGVTRTAAQAIPISGGYIGDANDTLGLDVCVAVSAVPI